MEIMGTSSMKFKYASDVDLFDVIYVHTDLEAFKVRVKKFFQNMIYLYYRPAARILAM
jgi:hypothetical protein